MKVDVEKIITTALQMKVSVYITEDSVSITPWGGAEKEEPKQEPKKAVDPKKQGARKTIDMGKVKALRDAGWSVEAIAEEMGVSKPTIVSRLKEE